ncbi:MAG: hypothetical protein WCB50_12260, partial [Pseudolabrys sp.]
QVHRGGHFLDQALAARFGSLADICSALTNCFCYFDCLLKHAGTGSVLWFPAKILAFDVRFGSKADMCSAQADVRFTPNSRHVRRS